ncbi:MAG: TolC family protein [Smithella sp.]|nr:TolC family protein [Smithella sp.]
MQIIIILIAAFLSLFPLTAIAGDPPDQVAAPAYRHIFGYPDEGDASPDQGAALNLQRCIEIALEKHPSLKASAGAIKVNESKVGQAKANYYPQLNLSTGYDRIGPASPAGTTPDAYDKYSAGINLGMTLFDFGKTATQVEIQGLSVNASRADYDNVRDQIVLNVKNAYYNLLQTQRNLIVAVDTMQQFQQHLDQANAFFRIGTKPKFDVTKAEVDFGNARLNVLKAENAVRSARITLKDVMGIPENADFAIVDNLGFEKSGLQLNDVLNTAYSNRPDLRSIIAKREATEKSIHLAQKGYYPTLSGSAGYGYSGTDFPLGSGWNAGATLNFPLFSGFSTKYQVDEARANLEILKANEDTLRQSIRLDVQQAYLNVQDAAEQISMAEMTVLQAKENYDLAAGRYRVGVGSPMEVADATITLNNARANLNTALYNYKMAQAALEKSIGEKP